MKKYNVQLEIGGQIVSDFTVNAENKTDATAKAQMHKRAFAREQSKVMSKGRIKTKVSVG